MKIQDVKQIEVSDWDREVMAVYGRQYNFQQQDGCKPRQIFHLQVPGEAADFARDTVPEKVNDELRGVSFAAWLARDPTQKLPDPREQEAYCLELWWDRNFYPHVQMIANDLHAKGLLPAGDYQINIEW